MTTAAKTELFTVRDYIRYAVSRFNAAQLFFGHGSDNAWDEAVYLTLHTLNLPLDRLEPFLDARLLTQERDALLEIYRRRCEDRLPAAYLTNGSTNSSRHGSTIHGPSSPPSTCAPVPAAWPF